jgi:hypothetical protein
MVPKALGHVSLRRCEGCDAVFLERAALGALVEAENDWHAHQSANTAQNGRLSLFRPGNGIGWILSSGACSTECRVVRSSRRVRPLAATYSSERS